VSLKFEPQGHSQEVTCYRNPSAFSILPQVEEKSRSQKMNEMCPKCGANWEAVNESLSNDGLDREQAILIINNCAGCREHFQYLLPIYSRLEVELAKGAVG